MTGTARASAAALVCLIALSAAGCGDPLVPADVVRQPIFSVSGTTTPDLAPSGTLRVTALWVDP
ncbi:MAG TPA: hypothetical protein VNO55_28395, partial [Polyangia bacterium]|nr:hypothetical protein [Polyangia bacterium]